MSMLDGVSQCWWLSETCVVNWDAWAAVGTMLAVVVALGVGVLPEVNRRREGRARALGQMHLAETALETQLLHLGRAIAASQAAAFDFNVRQQVLAEMEYFDPPVVAGLLSFSEHLGTDAFKATARCAVDMQRVHTLVSQFKSTPVSAVVEGGRWLSEYLVAAYLSMDDARLAYSAVLGRAPNDIPEVPFQVRAARRRGE
ncbi:hypothetical protein [Stenotrophomonas sp.]|uniref:hypothetical protein n=1 Tax=Stenotrophomonas sp. TaxID=69392 RepID=UPI0028B06169|nr:hypothetical protein [Stenotrophomonas sp.]